MISYYDLFLAGDLIVFDHPERNGIKNTVFFLVLKDEKRKIGDEHVFMCINLGNLQEHRVFYKSIGEYLETWENQSPVRFYRQGILQEIGY